MTYSSPIVSQITQDVFDINLAFAAQTANRLTGMQPTPDDLSCAFRDFEAEEALYPESEWPDRIEAADKNESWKYGRIVYPHDQDGEGTCVYNMSALMMQIMWNTQFGDDWALQFSPVSGYRWNASGPQSGANVGQAALWCENTGLLPSRGNPKTQELLTKGFIDADHPNVGWSNSFKPNWKNTARFFRIDEWFRVTSVAAWVTAQLKGYVCGGGRDMHAICHCGLAMDAGKLLSLYCNSWGLWGMSLKISGGKMLKSFGVDSRSKISTMVGRDAWACRTTLRPSFMKNAA